MNGITMTDKTEAQPEALRLAAEFEDCVRIDAIPSINDVKKSATELRRQHAEIQQLKAQKAHFRDALTDISSGEITRSHCVGPHCTEELSVATADELSSRAAGALNWDDLVAQQFPDVGIPISAQLSARQAAPVERLRAALERIIGWNRDHANELCGNPDRAEGWACVREARFALSAAPPPPEREPLTVARIDDIGDATGKPSKTWHYEFARAIERAHGIGATND